MIVVPLLGLMVALAPYHGPPQHGVVNAPGTRKFAVVMRGQAGQKVHLVALHVPAGYVASFCTPRVCAPFAVTLKLPQSGTQSIELQLIENIEGARRPKQVTVSANGASPISINFLRGTYM